MRTHPSKFIGSTRTVRKFEIILAFVQIAFGPEAVGTLVVRVRVLGHASWDLVVTTPAAAAAAAAVTA